MADLNPGGLGGGKDTTASAPVRLVDSRIRPHRLTTIHIITHPLIIITIIIPPPIRTRFPNSFIMWPLRSEGSGGSKRKGSTVGAKATSIENMGGKALSTGSAGANTIKAESSNPYKRSLLFCLHLAKDGGAPGDLRLGLEPIVVVRFRR